MVTLLEYALIADAVYSSSYKSSEPLTRLMKRGWTCPSTMKRDDESIWEGGSLFSSGLQCRVFQNGKGDSVIAYKGTRPVMMADLVADARLAAGGVPTQAKDALKLAWDWTYQLKGQRITLTGHSLGGALAQVVGEATRHRFVTFNAPGMLKQSHGLSSKQSALINNLKENEKGFGINYRTSGGFSPIAGLGEHIGEVVVLDLTDTGHGIGNFVKYLGWHKDGQKTPLA